MPDRDHAETDTALTAWTERLVAALGHDVPVDRDAVLGLAGMAAHGVVRPAAPLTTYVAGYVAGLRAAAGEDPEEALADVVAHVRDLLRDAERGASGS